MKSKEKKLNSQKKALDSRAAKLEKLQSDLLSMFLFVFWGFFFLVLPMCLLGTSLIFFCGSTTCASSIIFFSDLFPERIEEEEQRFVDKDEEIKLLEADLKKKEQEIQLRIKLEDEKLTEVRCYSEH